MTEKVRLDGTTIIFETEITVPTDQKTTWRFLTETDKFAQWFPEIQAGEIKEDGYLIFDMADFHAKMPIITFAEYEKLSFIWDSGQVDFLLTAKNQQETTLFFRDILPAEFPERHRDIAGWHIVLTRLQRAIAQNETDYPLLDFKEIEDHYQQLIAELVEK